MFTSEQSMNDINEALESWDWLNFTGKQPFLVTCFGDIFFESSEGIYFFDTLEGSLELVSKDKVDFQNLLNSEKGQDHYLMAGLVQAAQKKGLELKKGQCYDFNISPILNGEMHPDNLSIMDFKSSLRAAGKIIKQVKDMPVGTIIGEVKIESS